MTGRVTCAVSGGVADVRLDRPEKRNALDPAMFAALVEAGTRLRGDRSVRAVVLSGNGPDFCAGLDLASFSDPHRAATELATRIAAQSPDAVRWAKRLLEMSGRVDRATGFAAEQQALTELIGRSNQAEAVAAAQQRRPPRFAD